MKAATFDSSSMIRMRIGQAPGFRCYGVTVLGTDSAPNTGPPQHRFIPLFTTSRQGGRFALADGDRRVATGGTGGLDGAVGPADLDAVHAGRRAKAEEEAPVALRQVTGAAADVARLAARSGHDAHTGAEGVAVSARAF